MRYLWILLAIPVAQAQVYPYTSIPPSNPPALITTKPLTLNGTYNGPGTLNQNYIGINGVLSGSVTNSTTFAPLKIQITSTNFQKTASDTAVPVLKLVHNFGGSGDVGSFSGLGVETNMLTTTGNKAAGVTNDYVGGIFLTRCEANDGGTGNGVGLDDGNCYGLNSETRLFAGATYWHGAFGYEAGLGITTGASVTSKLGIVTYLTSLDQVDAVYENSAFSTGKSNVALSNGWDLALAIGTYDSYWPMAATGTIIGCMRHAAAAGGSCGTTTNGIDFSRIIFTGNAFQSSNFTVDGSGNFTGSGTYKINNNAGSATTEIGDNLTTGTVTIGSGLNNVALNAGTLATLKGAGVQINTNASTNTTEIGTGSTSGTVTLGGGSDTISFASPINIAGRRYISVTAPTINAHFNTSGDSIVAASTGAFQVTVGNGTGTTTGSLTMPAATTGWACSAADVTTPATHMIQQTASSSTGVTVTDYNRTTGIAQNMANGDVIVFHCGAL